MELTWDKIEAEVRRLAAERPDYVYPKAQYPEGIPCTYTTFGDTRPRCIFGEALHNLGVSDSVLKAHEGVNVGIILADLGVERTDEQNRWAYRVQTTQDDARTWADAIKAGDTAYNR